MFIPTKSRLWNSKPEIHFWANLGPKIQSCLFCLKIGAHSISRMQIPNTDLEFWKSDPKIRFWANFGRKSQAVHFFWKLACMASWRCWFLFKQFIFGQIWTEKVKVVCFAWNLAHPRYRYWFLFWYQFSQILNLNLEDADSYSEISFLKFQTYIYFLGKFESKKLNSLILPGSCYTVSWG